MLHQFAPARDRQPPGTFFIPGDLLNLQSVGRREVKNCSTEEKEQWHFAVYERVEVFRRRDIEVVPDGKKIEQVSAERHPYQFTIEAEHFAECIRNHQEPEAPGEEGLKDMLAIEAIYKAAGAPIA